MQSYAVDLEKQVQDCARFIWTQPGEEVGSRGHEIQFNKINL